MKPKAILPLNWRNELADDDIISIGNDVILLDKPVVTSSFQQPFRVDVTATIISITGRTEGIIDMKPYITDKPCFVTILPGQVMQYKSISDDFSGHFIIMSNKFTNSLMPEAHGRLPLSLSVRSNPVIPLSDESLEGMILYFNMMKRMAIEKEHPNRLDVARHLTLAFFYGASVDFHKIVDDRDRKKTSNEVLTDKFLSLIQVHHKQERGLGFYSAKLCVTAKHLSRVVSATSGKTANDLIDYHVIFEAKALLKSTNMSIDQISDELNFPSQSFFGKYFKRVTGMSPKEYKASK